MEEYLEKYELLWGEIDQHDPPLPCMDLAMNLIDECDYYGLDFRGEKKVYMLFFTGQSNYFPGINVRKGEAIDESPIYIFDIASFEKPELIGNFKTYIKTLLDNFIANSGDEQSDFLIDAKQALLELDQFSNTLSRKGDW